MEDWNFKKRTFRFTQGEKTFTYEIENVGRKKPYSHAQWLLTYCKYGKSFLSEQYQLTNDLKKTFADMAVCSDKVEMIQNY